MIVMTILVGIQLNLCINLKPYITPSQIWLQLSLILDLDNLFDISL